MVGVNRGLISDPAAPFGGVKQSGSGARAGTKGCTSSSRPSTSPLRGEITLDAISTTGGPVESRTTSEGARRTDTAPSLGPNSIASRTASADLTPIR